ncbi:MAG: MBL fold metallo-hydrolase [Deltaproteobacteria bacterium]|nr:MBL fold metallo-hydrolase [Deltaproteobacteria bacterium]
MSAILVGHAHYDHLMDIPYIAQERAPHATIYGSLTMKNILAAILPAARLVALDREAAEPAKMPGKWESIPGTKIRIMAIKSQHAPHVCLFQRHGCIKVFTGEVAAPLDRLPKTAWGWKEGQTIAYLIDFLDNTGAVKFRIYYQDAASAPPWGFPPTSELEIQTPVDLAILCVPGFKYVQGYPQGIIQWIKPRFVILTHWEDFSRPRTGDPSNLRVVPDGSDPTIFIKQIEEALPTATWLMPRPGAWLRFELDKLQAQPSPCGPESQSRNTKLSKNSFLAS